MKSYLSVVIPAFNEEKNIRRTLLSLEDFLKSQGWRFEIIIVDDGSTDETSKIVKDIIEGKKEFKLLKIKHRGKGFAVRKGVLKANGEYILFTDADLSVPPEEVKRFFVWLTEHDFDLAIGSREGLGAKRIDEPWYRHVLGRGFNFLIKILMFRGIEDTQCGFKLFKGETAKDIFGKLLLYGEDAPLIKEAKVTAFDVEVLFLAKKLGYKIKEVPITWRHVKTQKVHPLFDSWRMFLDVLRVRWNDLRGLYDFTGEM